MSFNGINGMAIQKASDIINEIINYGKLNKYKITIAAFYEFYKGVQGLYKNGETETISESVKNLYEKCGFKAEPNGTGWKINGMNYTWKWQLDERGFNETPFANYTEWQNKVKDYVEKYLSPSIKNANCGWDHCVFYVLESQHGIEEYIALYPEEENQDGRYINVSSNSLGAIAEATWNSVYR